MHIPWGDRAGDANFGEAANLNTDEILLRWFNHWLKDSRRVRTASRAFAILRWARTNGALRTSGRRRREFALYLHSGGNANSRKGDGTLAMTRAGG